MRSQFRHYVMNKHEPKNKQTLMVFFSPKHFRLFCRQNPRWLRSMAATSSQRRWCHLLSTLEAPLLGWIESFTLLFITLWLIVVKWKTKACVVPLSSGSGTGSSQSFFNLWKRWVQQWMDSGEETKMQPMAGENKPRTWARCKMRRSEQRCFLEPSV